MPGSPISLLLPLPHDLVVTALTQEPTGVCVQVQSTRPLATCPLCATPSAQVHSQYERHPADLPCAGQPVQLRLRVRKFFCRIPHCARKIFAERLPDLLAPSSRLTARLRGALQELGVACSGRRGAQLATSLGMPISDTTLLWSVQRLTPPTPEEVRVVGVDDWSWRRGQRYGTIIVDLERHQVLDILPDREVETITTWLRAHPAISVVSRDRGRPYIEGATQGAPQAIQVADRWHLYKNLGDAVEAFLIRTRVRLPLSGDSPISAHVAEPSESRLIDSPPLQPCPPLPPAPSQVSAWRRHKLAQERLTDKWTMHHHIIAQRHAGVSIRALAQHLGLARNTVRKYARQPLPPMPSDPTPRPARASVLDPYEAYLLQRWAEGCRNAALVLREIQALGYTGGKTTVRAYFRYLRVQASSSSPGAEPHSRQRRAQTSSPRTMRWLFVRQSTDLDPDEQARLARILAASVEVASLYTLVQGFHLMLREHRPERLEGWLALAETSGIREMQSFAAGVKEDVAAVMAAMSLPWSQGQTEGQVNKLKLLKRQGYGRMSFPLLRQRLLCQDRRRVLHQKAG